MKIIIPSDFSENVKRVIDFVYKVIPTQHFDVELVHALPNVTEGSGLIISTKDLIKKEAETHMVFVLEYIINTYALVANHTIKSGELIDVVKGIVLNNTQGVVVLNRWGNPVESFFDSEAEQFIKQTDIPVLLVPNNMGIRPIQQVALMLDNAMQSLNGEIEIVKAICSKTPILNTIISDPLGNRKMDYPDKYFQGVRQTYQVQKAQTEFQSLVKHLNDNPTDLLLIKSKDQKLISETIKFLMDENNAGKISVPVLVLSA